MPDPRLCYQETMTRSPGIIEDNTLPMRETHVHTWENGKITTRQPSKLIGQTNSTSDSTNPSLRGNRTVKATRQIMICEANK
jgi:hypothetical protein